HWPEPLIRGVAGDLFPSVLSAKDLAEIIERTPETEAIGGSFAWALRQIATNIEPWSKPAIELRDVLTHLIWRGRDEEQDGYHFASRFNYVAPALALLSDKQLTERPTSADPMLIR